MSVFTPSPYPLKLSMYFFLPLEILLSQIGNLPGFLTLFITTRERLTNAIENDPSHAWTNSVGKGVFTSMLQVILPHYGLWVYVVQYVSPILYTL